MEIKHHKELLFDKINDMWNYTKIGIDLCNTYEQLLQRL